VVTPSLELITESTLEVEVLNLERKSEYAAEGKSGISSHSQLGFLITYLKQSKKKKTSSDINFKKRRKKTAFL
jgi:hypothetical protein